MSDEQLKSNVAALLVSHGFHVKSIPENSGKTPDFCVCDNNGMKYLIELKEKNDIQSVAEIRKTLKGGDIHHHSRSFIYSNPHAKSLDRAVKQLNSYHTDEHFKLVFLACLGFDAESERNIFEHTLYGKRDLIPHDHLSGNVPKHNYKSIFGCYFFGESIFFTHKSTLDGAIILWRSGDDCQWLLCINSLSKNAEALYESKLRSIFSDAGVLYPINSSNTFVLTADVDRRNEQAVIDEVKKQTGIINIQTFDFGMMSVSTIIQSEN